MSSVFLRMAKKVLDDEKRPLSVTEIWDLASAKGYGSEMSPDAKTPWKSLSAFLHGDVLDNPKTIFISVGERPKKFALKSFHKSEDGEVVDIEDPKKHERDFHFLEKDLHPLMVYYGFTYLNAHLKTINHNKAGKKDYGEWVHPDLVGCYFPFRDWQTEVVDVSSMMGFPTVKLYSFELKRELSFGNIREAFFQAVSNSSWANEGYLVAAEIDKNEDFQTELLRLSSSFGIGVIRLNMSDPDSCEKLLAAQEKENIDWETVNKLSKMNPDFHDFLKRIRIDIRSREIRKELYDKVLEKEELIQKFKTKT